MNGYWNGEKATFKGVTYEVAKPEVETWWQNRFIGETRQGVEVSYAGETWIIDNHHGDGFHKVTRGLGSPRCPHKSIDNPINVKYLKDKDINMHLDKEALKRESKEHEEWMKTNYPEDYRKLEALKKHLKQH